MTPSRRLAVVAFSIIALLGAVMPAVACWKPNGTEQDKSQYENASQTADQNGSPPEDQTDGKTSCSQTPAAAAGGCGAQPPAESKPPEQPEQPAENQQPEQPCEDDLQPGGGGECGDQQDDNQQPPQQPEQP